LHPTLCLSRLTSSGSFKKPPVLHAPIVKQDFIFAQDFEKTPNIGFNPMIVSFYSLDRSQAAMAQDRRKA